MYRIKNLSVKNYRNISNANVSFNDFNVIVGPNNSGKTNFVRVINFLNMLISSSITDLKNNFGWDNDNGLSDGIDFIIPKNKLRNKTGSIHFQLIYENTVNSNLYWYEIELIWENRSSKKIEGGNMGKLFSINYESLKYKNPSSRGPAKIIFDRNSTIINYGSTVPKKETIVFAPSFYSTIGLLELTLPKKMPKEIKEAIDGLKKVVTSPIFFFSNNDLREYWKKKKRNNQSGRVCSMNISEEIEEIKTEEYKNELLSSVIKDILNIDSIDIIEMNNNEDFPKFVTIKQFEETKDLEDLSDGSLLILAIIISTINSKSDIIFIEEPENSIHPKALVKLISFLKQFSFVNQFIITTHSIALLNKSNIDEIIVMEVDDFGNSKIQNIHSQKDLYKKLKNSNFSNSDELYFSDKNEIIEDED